MKRTTLQETLDKTKAMVLDGAMSTPLERMGCNLSDSLWTARILAQEPELVEKVHRDYFAAGADACITASYQASIPGLVRGGYSQEQAQEIIRRSVTLLFDARQKWWDEEGERQGRAWPLCLGDVGPYGAYLADGSEYRGRYGVSEEDLREFHYRRMQLLWESGADLLLIETQPSLQEALVEAEIAEELGADYWISFSCADRRHTCEGTSIRECARALSQDHPHLRMIGVNCTRPEYIEDLIGELVASTQLPVAVYPNSGEKWDAERKVWVGTGDQTSFGEYAARWYRAGAACVGGCCTTTAEHIAQVREARDAFVAGGCVRRMHH